MELKGVPSNKIGGELAARALPYLPKILGEGQIRIALTTNWSADMSSPDDSVTTHHTDSRIFSLFVGLRQSMENTHQKWARFYAAFYLLVTEIVVRGAVLDP